MPIFHDPNDSPPAPSYLAHTSPTNLERGGATGLDSEDDWGNAMRQEEALTAQRSLEVDVESSTHTRKPCMFGRNEWIERIKKTNSPSWLQWQGTDIANHGPIPPRPTSGDRPSLPRTPTTELQASRTSTPDHVRDAAAAGLDIQRPRSALHSGDFREQRAATATDHGHSSAGFVATSPVVPWDRSFPAAGYPTRTSHVQYSEPSNDDTRTVARARATSHSSHSQFTLLPPTSPLVYQANNTDLDFSSGPSSRKTSPSPDRNNRRHTFTPPSFQPYQSIQMARSATGTPAARHLRHGTSLPYQAHQPRRSMTNNISEPYSPLTHTLSEPPTAIFLIRSIPTPTRSDVPFPAVFYSYNTGNGRISDNEPSPYVGLIDLENSLPAPDESKESGKRKRRHAVPPPDQDDLDFRIHLGDEESLQTTKGNLRRKEKKKRRSTSPKAPPGGCYRIPPQGQLQIVLKNPNKTAVKLFLVPYDLSDMEPGQKTFIRQRSYSAGPIIDMPSSSRKNLGTDCPEAALSSSDDPNDRPILRYLIHLHICCPSKGRHYLYKSIRVVFANRVPDGKEKLRNEIQQPEPRYSTYKPTRDSMASQKTQSSGPQLTDKVSRRRSAGWPLSHSQQAYDALDNIRQHTPLPPPAVKFTGDNANSSASSSFSSHVADLQPIPFALSRLAAIHSRPVSRECMDVDPKSPFRTPVTSPRPVVSPNSSNDGTFEKLSKGDIGYGGNAFSPLGSPTGPPNAGLLSQKLRGLDVQRDGEEST
ncbi:Chromosome-seg domain-containing protein [Pyrenophora tritici-repentis]|nr:Chromosome-seg domain-containing protein [Pyrenophora tritici-repentis]KAI0616587.1 Chromosome-seg domain-containing protein [Pyrenophora tritici-repentis]